MFTNPFLTPFVDEIINEVMGHECYSFIDGFLGYNQVPIAKEGYVKIDFVLDFGLFAYRVMPLGLNNALDSFFYDSSKGIANIHIQNNGSAQLWTIYNLLKNHIDRKSVV